MVCLPLALAVNTTLFALLDGVYFRRLPARCRIGVAAGRALSVVTVLRGYLYGLSPFDPVAFAGAALAWVLIAMWASWWPARRGTRVGSGTNASCIPLHWTGQCCDCAIRCIGPALRRVANRTFLVSGGADCHGAQRIPIAPGLSGCCPCGMGYKGAVVYASRKRANGGGQYRDLCGMQWSDIPAVGSGRFDSLRQC
jgi:hypothetical protein